MALPLRDDPDREAIEARAWRWITAKGRPLILPREVTEALEAGRAQLRNERIREELKSKEAA